jgi:hypothetical protein
MDNIQKHINCMLSTLLNAEPLLRLKKYEDCISCTCGTTNNLKLVGLIRFSNYVESGYVISSMKLLP